MIEPENSSIRNIWRFKHLNQLIQPLQGFDLVQTPAVGTISSHFIFSFGFVQLYLGQPLLLLEAIKLYSIAFHANLLGAVQAVAMFLAWKHRIIMYAEAVLSDMSDAFTNGLQIGIGNRGVDLNFLEHPTNTNAPSQLDNALKRTR